MQLGLSAGVVAFGKVRLTWEQTGRAVRLALPPVRVDLFNLGDAITFLERQLVVLCRVVAVTINEPSPTTQEK